MVGDGVRVGSGVLERAGVTLPVGGSVVAGLVVFDGDGIIACVEVDGGGGVVEAVGAAAGVQEQASVAVMRRIKRDFFMEGMPAHVWGDAAGLRRIIAGIKNPRGDG
jgi:hypothetical protein